LISGILAAGFATAALATQIATNLANGSGATGNAKIDAYRIERTRGDEPRAVVLSKTLADAIGL